MLMDFELEQKWDELTDIPFKEVEDGLRLEQDWWIFKAGTDREDIWMYFDDEHSKGVQWLLYDRDMAVNNF